MLADVEQLLASVGHIVSLIAQSKEEASNELFDRIGRAADQSERRELLALRRRIYNEKPLTAAQRRCIEDGHNDLPASNALLRALDRLRETRTHIQTLVEAQVHEARETVFALLQDDLFAQGILSSSPALFEAASRIGRRRDGDFSKRRQIAAGLYRYANRCVSKATPFSGFCVLEQVALVRGAEPVALELEGGAQVHVSLDRATFEPVIQAILTDASIRAELRLRINPTLRSDGDTLSYIASRGRNEHLQSLKRSPALSAILECITGLEYPTIGRVGEALAVASPTLEATPDELQAYLERLIEIGIVQRSVGLSESDGAWVETLLVQLEHLQSPSARTITEQLRALRVVAARYHAATVSARSELLREARALLATLAPAVSQSRLDASQPFGVDVTARRARAAELPGNWSAIESEISQLVVATAPMSRSRQERAELRTFYDRTFGTAERVPLLKFYDVFTREFLAPNRTRLELYLRGAEDPSGKFNVVNPSGSPAVEAMLRAEARLWEFLASVVNSGDDEEVRLDIADIVACTSHLPAVHDFLSVSVFATPVPAPAVSRVVLKHAGYSPGYGRMYSRFLPLLPASTLEAMRAVYRVRSGQPEFVELLSQVNHGTNARPAILKSVLAAPGADYSSDMVALSLVDVDIARDELDDTTVHLINRHTGAMLQPIDVSFVALESRPPLAKFLARFRGSGEYYFRLPFRGAAVPAHLADLGIPARPVHSSLSSQPADVQYRPRIVAGHSVVLSRQTWRVPRASIPVLETEEVPQYLEVLHAWRTERGIPAEAYVEFDVSQGFPGSRDDAAEGDGATARAPVTRAWSRQQLNERKPERVHFANALHVQTFSDAVRGSSAGHVDFVETYPAGVDAGRRSSELLLQLDDGRFSKEVDAHDRA